MAFGEDFLGAFLGVIKRLASAQVLEIAKRLKIRPRLQKLESRSWVTQQLLDEAENQQIKSQVVKTWVRDLRDWAYDADDLLDEFATKSCRLKRAGVVDTSGSSRRITSFMVRALNLISLLASNVMFIGYIYRAAAKIDEICARLDEFYAQKARPGLEVGVNNTRETWQRTHAKSRYFHPKIYDRVDVEKRIINLLLGTRTGQGSSGANKLDVIVDTEGIGKTTLAHPVFNNASKDMNLTQLLTIEVDMEHLSGQYFRELLSSSLFQYANGDKSRFVMHDFVNDLARFVAVNSYANLEEDCSFENARHVVYGIRN